MSAGQFKQIDPNATGEQTFINDDYRTYNFDVIDGVTYDIDITEPAKYDGEGAIVNDGAERIENLQYEGAAIDPNQEFLVVTNNYRASGNFPGVRNATETIDFAYENRQAIQDYIVEEGTIDPSADGNWQFAPVAGDPNLVFETSNAAKSLVEQESAIQYIEVTQNGFAKYGYTIQ